MVVVLRSMTKTWMWKAGKKRTAIFYRRIWRDRTTNQEFFQKAGERNSYGKLWESIQYKRTRIIRHIL